MIPQSVLIIDDANEVHHLLDARLASEGLRMYHALSPDSGMDVALTCQPDLILLDLEMPGTDGFELCRQFKADPSTMHIPIVFLTGTSDVDTKVRGFDLGAVDYVTKPFDPVELRARVRSTLRTKRYQDLLSARAQIDALTGLNNRAYFEQRIADEVAAASRYGRDVSLVMMDIDHFKGINDAHGHPFGDLVLQRAGELLGSLSRTTDAACRYGGEEFALILSETSVHGAISFAERVREALGSLTLVSRGGVVRVTASFGVADTATMARNGTLSVRSLLEAADAALYSAKHAGRDRVMSADARGLGATRAAAR